MASFQQPVTRRYEHNAPAAAATTDVTTVLCEIAEAGVVSSVQYIPVAAVTGANTNTRTLTVVNKGAAGTGTATVAAYALTSGNNLVANTPNAITLSATGAALVVNAGDVLEWTSVHAASGLADPGGLVHVETTRS